MKQIVWKRYRRAVEILQALLLTGLPFLKINGQSALRFDIGELNLYFFGTVIRIGEFYLILAATLFLLLFISAVTVIFGRVWCGWLCPQTVLLDLTDSLATIFGRKHRNTIQKVILIPVSALVSITMIWYFVPPADTMNQLFTSPLIAGFFFVLWASVYAELAFLGRNFCTSICPYAMMQNALFDKDTLVIEYDQSRDSTCMKCDDCVRACPVGIDIKDGLSNRCIACAECIDACWLKSSKRNLPPFPNYKGKILRPKSYLLAAITTGAAIVLAILIASRPTVDFMVSRVQEPLPAGLNRYTYTIYNNSPRDLDLELTTPDGVTMIGEHSIRVNPFGVVRGKVLLRANSKRDQVTLTIKGDGISISKETGFL
ncbi:MAG: 4Fe-4S binding protein [Chlorobiaceae bacterium]|nr:4Fe-4S binding protein [Chlorobiales bacterium]NTU91721.1 4Fe-4S binding protein [Chlorobiaceae bacterium]